MNILEKLNYLKQYDVNYLIFGAAKHKYVLNGVLSERKLKAFEDKYKIKLPEDYRSFIKNIGNGGAGPGYGLFPLEEKDRLHEYLGLQYPFQFTSDLVLEDQESEFECACDDCGKCGFHSKCYFSNFIDGKYIDEYLYQQGSLSICFEGCTYYQRMILNGPSYGKIWSENEGEGLKRSELNFEEWYTAWLDCSIETISPFVRAVKERKPFNEILAISNEGMGLFDFDHVKARFLEGMLCLHAGTPGFSGTEQKKYVQAVKLEYERKMHL